MASKRISGYCSCGGTFHGTSNPPKAASALYAAWRLSHDRDGHTAVDQRTAAAVRRRETNGHVNVVGRVGA